MVIYAYLQFPNLLLDAQGVAHHNECVAIHHQGHIKQCSESALAEGVVPGMTLSMALTLCPHLLTKAYQADAERRLLHRFALWAYQYSHQVAIWNQGLCIEVSKSKSLFGDLSDLTQTLKNAAASQNFQIQLAFGYTPEMAALFVQEGLRPKEHAFQKTLSRISIDAVAIPRDQIKRLKNMGFRTIGDYFSAPSRARQARIHQNTFLYFDAIAGRYQTPLSWFSPPPVFDQSIEFLRGLESVDMLKFPINRLTQDAAHWLRQRVCATSQLRWEITLENKHIEHLNITLNHPVNSAVALADPSWLQLEKLRPASPMTGIRLTIQQVHQASPIKRDLFVKTHDTDRSQLLDRLTARLGKECIKTPRRLQDPRPEYANQLDNNKSTYPLPNLPPRPLWLIQPPEPLGSSPEKAGHTLLQGPERIESGWWDFEPACRRYWVCLFQQKRISWIYQDQHSKSWWLAGWFT
jgi:protein ImuB